VYDYIIIYKEIMSSSVIDVKGKDPVAETDTVEVTNADTTMKVTQADAEANTKTGAEANTKTGADTEAEVKVAYAKKDASNVNDTDAANNEKEAESILQQLPDEIKTNEDIQAMIKENPSVAMVIEKISNIFPGATKRALQFLEKNKASISDIMKQMKDSKDNTVDIETLVYNGIEVSEEEKTAIESAFSVKTLKESDTSSTDDNLDNSNVKITSGPNPDDKCVTVCSNGGKTKSKKSKLNKTKKSKKTKKTKSKKTKSAKKRTHKKSQRNK
jgi:hypothetical protein